MRYEYLKQALLFYKQAIYALIFIAIVIVLLNQFTNVDLAIADYYYDPVLKTFAWKETWFAKNLMHHYVKDCIIAAGVSLIVFVIFDGCKNFQWLDDLSRFKLRFVASAAIIIPYVISTLKHHSILHCPSDIDRYGGNAPFLRLLDHLPSGLHAGHCFPAGHASTGLWLAAIGVFWLPNHPKTALKVFFAGLSVGFLLGWVQQMRGAHFLFHTLWSTWLASAMVVTMLIFTHFLFIQKKHLCHV